MSMMKSSIITVGQYVNVRFIYGYYTYSFFGICIESCCNKFSSQKIINVSCDDNGVNLSYIIIVPFGAYTRMVKCFFGSMNFNFFDVCGLKCVSLKHNI
jgi:hypothetical protein